VSVHCRIWLKQRELPSPGYLANYRLQQQHSPLRNNLVYRNSSLSFFCSAFGTVQSQTKAELTPTRRAFCLLIKIVPW
jgi:hypothetical protein